MGGVFRLLFWGSVEEVRSQGCEAQNAYPEFEKFTFRRIGVPQQEVSTIFLGLKLFGNMETAQSFARARLGKRPQGGRVDNS